MNSPNVGKLYQGVIDDVINGVREAFLDEGVDEQILQELKQLWESKVVQHKAVVDGSRQHHAQTTAAAAAAAAAASAQSAVLVAVDGAGRDRLQQHPAVPQPRPAAPQVPQVLYSLQSAGPLDLSGAAATAAMALPSALYQHLGNLGGFTIQQTQQGQIVAVPTGLPIVQLPAQLQGQMEPQNLSKPKDGSSGMHVVQLDGCADDDPSNSSAGATSAQAPSSDVACCSEGDLNQSPTGACCASRRRTCRRRRAGKPVEIVIVMQTDGAHGNSSSDDDDDEDEDDGRGVDDDNADAGDDDEIDGEGGSNDDKPLNSDDDVDDGASDLFDTENLIVCQFDKINRSKSKWKFHLKDGIMNLKGKDYVFHKATGEAEW